MSIPILANACLSFDDDSVLISTTDLGSMQTVKVKPKECQYPDTEEFLKPRENELKFAIDAKLLKIIADYVIKVSKGKGSSPIVFSFVNDCSHIRFSFETDDGQRGEGAVMPMRV